MGQYRIVTDIYFDGCVPVTVYVVQKRVRLLLFYKWINIKGFEYKSRAVDLLNFLK